MTTKNALEALAMDLKRVANAYHRGSNRMAEVFIKESLSYVPLINKTEVKPHIQDIVSGIPTVFKQVNKKQLAELALMYGTLLQNYCVSQMKKD